MAPHITLKKPFTLQKEWNASQASVLDDFLNKLVDNHLSHRHDTYTGTGRSQLIKFSETISKPVILVLYNRESGASKIVMEPGVDVASWTNRDFTLTAGSSYNTSGTSYMFFFLADAEL